METVLKKAERTEYSATATKTLLPPEIALELERHRTDEVTRAWVMMYPDEIYAVNDFRREIGLPVLTRTAV